MRYNFKNSIEDVKRENLQICVVSYGGSCTNTLQQRIQQLGFITKTSKWGSVFCHLPEYVNLGIPIIYLYDNPKKSFLSQKNRASTIQTNLKKLSNDDNLVYSDEKFIEHMIKQFHSFTDTKRDDVLIVKSSELFNKDIIEKLSTFLKKDCSDIFPLKYVTPKAKIDDRYKELFDKYEDEIKYINEFHLCS